MMNTENRLLAIGVAITSIGVALAAAGGFTQHGAATNAGRLAHFATGLLCGLGATLVIAGAVRRNRA